MKPPLLVAPLLGLLLATAAARQDGGSAGEPAKPWRVGSRVTEGIALPELDDPDAPDGAEDGPRVVLPEDPPTEDDPVVVLVFWSLRDPVARVYEKRLTALRDSYPARDVVLYLVESNHDELVSGVGDPLAKLRAFREETKLTLPILLDERNRIADDFAALTANHAFVLDRARVLRYAGGIDDDPKGAKGPAERRPWLKEAIEAALRGESPEHPVTRPTGRRIKRAPGTGPAPGAAKGR